jgi:hypothetical protein
MLLTTCVVSVLLFAVMLAAAKLLGNGKQTAGKNTTDVLWQPSITSSPAAVNNGLLDDDFTFDLDRHNRDLAYRFDKDFHCNEG